MSADPVTEPMPPSDPADLLAAIEEAAGYPMRPEYIEGVVVIPPTPNHNHNQGAVKLIVQFHLAGLTLAGVGNGYTTEGPTPEKRSLVIPDFYLLTREPTELDEAYRRAHQGWYPISLLALVGEITSTNKETDTGPKLRVYAGAGVPVYVLVHRQERLVYVYSDPVRSERRYATQSSYPLGGKVPLPAPYPVLDTAPLLPVE